MTKQKISITIDKKQIRLIENVLKNTKDCRFRNRSHVIEYSLTKFLDENNNLNKMIKEN